MDLENLNPTNSRIICSAPITRFRTIRKDIVLNENEEEFCILEYLMNRKDKQLKSNQQNSCPRSQPVILKRKREKDTDGIMKRFKHNFAYKNNTEIFNETDHKNSGFVSIPTSVPDETYDGVKSPELRRRKHMDAFIFEERSTYCATSEAHQYAASSSTEMLFKDEQFERLFFFDGSQFTPQ